MQSRLSRPATESGGLLLSVANEVVRVYKDHYGRGPTKCHCNFARDDTLVCVLEDVFTPAERTLVECGRQESVRDLHLSLHDHAGPVLKESVERLLGRSVRSVVTGIDPQNNIAVEAFILASVPA